MKVFSSVIASVSVLLASSCVNVPEEKETLFETMKVKASTETVVSSYTAKLKGKQDVDILPRVDGALTKIAVHEGQKIFAGQVMFVIDQKPFQIELQTAQANLLSAKAQQSTAKLSYENNKSLYEKGIVGKYVFDTAENSLRNANAAVALAEAQVARAQNSLSYCTVTSPVSGIVGTIAYRVGDLVGPSVAGALTTVSDNSTVEAYFSVNEGEYIELASVYGDDAVTKNIIGYPVSLKLKNGTIYAHEGKVVSCSGLIDPLTGTIPIKAEFPNPEGALRSGISGSVVASYEEDNMMVIPQTSVNRMQDKALAYVLQKDSTVKATIVEIEDMNDGKRYAVTKGLKVGDEIVSIGVNNLVDGQKISVKGK